MARVLYYELGNAPTPRSRRAMSTLRRHGWDVTVAHLPQAASRVEEQGFDSCLLPEPVGNLLAGRMAAQATEHHERLEQLKITIGDLADQVKQLRAGREAVALDDALDALRVESDDLVQRIQAARAARDEPAADAARLRLQEVKNQRAVLAAQVRAIGADQRARLEAAKRERAEVAARVRAIGAARNIAGPLSAGTTFGDLARLEPLWVDAAQAMAAVQADLIWAADLDALPPAVWAAAAALQPPPVVFDSHENFCALDYLPELYRTGWRSIADRFIPLATAVVTVSDPIARVLREVHGARQTLVIPNYASASTAAAPGQSLRQVLGLDRQVPLGVHVGNVNFGRNPELAVELLAGLAPVHVAFVGAIEEAARQRLQDLARARGVGQRLHFVPPVPLEVLTAFIGDADFSLILSDGRNSQQFALTVPYKYYDSLAAGVPVIAHESTEPGRMLVREGLGRTFSSPESLAQAAADLLQDDGVRGRVLSRRSEFVWAAAEPDLRALVDSLHKVAAEGGVA